MQFWYMCLDAVIISVCREYQKQMYPPLIGNKLTYRISVKSSTPIDEKIILKRGHRQPCGPLFHCSDVIMCAMASQITNHTIVYSTVYSGGDQRKHQSSASPAFVQGIHRWQVNSPHKWPVTRKMFPFDNVIMHKVTRRLVNNSRKIPKPWVCVSDISIGNWRVVPTAVLSKFDGEWSLDIQSCHLKTSTPYDMTPVHL